MNSDPNDWFARLTCERATKENLNFLLWYKAHLVLSSHHQRDERCSILFGYAFAVAVAVATLASS
jgi:hypothetical protein